MSRIHRIALISVLGCAGVMVFPATGSAQLQMSGGVGASLPGPIQSFPVGPLGVPFSAPSFRFNSSLGVRVGTPFGPSIGYGQVYSGALGWWLANGNTPLAPRYYTYPARPQGPNGPSSFLGYNGGNFMTGGVNPHLYNAQRDFARAQDQSNIARQYAGARDAIADQWAVERNNPNAPKAPGPGANANLPPDLLEAIAAPDDAKLRSGFYLNRIAVAIVAAEARGGKGPATQLGPQLLGEVRFGGSQAGDALNVIRRAGKLEFPAVFESNDALKALQPVLEQGIVALASPARLGKPVDSVKAQKFEADVKKAQDMLTPMLGTLPFEDAVAARRFLNQLDGAAKTFKDQRVLNGIVVPQWDSAGVSVQDLVRHMAKFKVLFGATEPSAEEAYLAVHQSLVGYLFVLEQSVPQKK